MQLLEAIETNPAIAHQLTGLRHVAGPLISRQFKSFGAEGGMLS